MVIAGLIIVISQALGLEILDAYTLRKTLPRVIIAAIAITLSWPLMRFAVTLTNDLGYGIRQLIYAPFSSLSSNLNFDFGSGAKDLLIGGSITTAGAVGGGIALWIYTGGVGILLAYVGTALLAILIGLMVLVLRQIVIIILMVLAPIAIAAYILPNTAKYYKLWWESFSKALIMFPLIAAFIATGRVFSQVSLQTGSGSDPINRLIAIIAYFAPYFLIPLTVKFAGGALSNIGGLVNSRSTGAFKVLGNYRKGARKSRLERARGAGLYRKKDGIPGFLNKVGFYTLNADEQVPYTLGAANGRLTKGKYNPLGIAGRAAFGRQASEMAGAKAGSLVEQNAKAVEKANLHYTSSWAALGMRDKLIKSGMTKPAIDAMDTKYGIKDENGAYVGWRKPSNTDYAGLVEYATDLEKAGEEGSNAKYAGRELREKAGILTSFGSHMETQRASLQSVAAVSAAKDGKLSLEDGAKIHNDSVEGAKGDLAGIAMAGAVMTQMENAATQTRQDWRRGKGMRVGDDGKTYSVYGNKVVKGTRADGTTFESVAYKTKAAQDSLLTAKAGSIGAGKAGEYFKETESAYIHWANERGPDGQLTQQAKELRETLVYQAGLYSQADPGAKAKTDELIAKVGIPAEEQADLMRGFDRDSVLAQANQGQPQQQPATGTTPQGGGPEPVKF